MADNRVWNLLKIVILTDGVRATSDNTAYMKLPALEIHPKMKTIKDIVPYPSGG